MAFNRDDLIRELSQNFQADKDGSEGGNKKRFHEDTLTLVSGKDAERIDEINQQQKKTERIEVALEVSEYADLILGKIQFFIIKNADLAEGDTVVFREFDNLKATGNINIKTLTCVKRDVPGIMDGYCVVAWN